MGCSGCAVRVAVEGCAGSRAVRGGMGVLSGVKRVLGVNSVEIGGELCILDIAEWFCGWLLRSVRFPGGWG